MGPGSAMAVDGAGVGVLSVFCAGEGRTAIAKTSRSRAQARWRIDPISSRLLKQSDSMIAQAAIGQRCDLRLTRTRDLATSARGLNGSSAAILKKSGLRKKHGNEKEK